MWAHLHIDWHVAFARPILIKLAHVLDNTLICLRWHRGLSDLWTSVLSGQREARPALLLLSPRGFLTQNKQKVCFLGLLKSCRHLVLYRGQIIHHSALPCSASVALLFSDFYHLCCPFFHCCWPLHSTQILLLLMYYFGQNNSFWLAKMKKCTSMCVQTSTCRLSSKT